MCSSFLKTYPQSHPTSNITTAVKRFAVQQADIEVLQAEAGEGEGEKDASAGEDASHSGSWGPGL